MRGSKNTITVPKALRTRLAEIAEAEGLTAEDYVISLIEKACEPPAEEPPPDDQKDSVPPAV